MYDRQLLPPNAGYQPAVSHGMNGLSGAGPDAVKNAALAAVVDDINRLQITQDCKDRAAGIARKLLIDGQQPTVQENAFMVAIQQTPPSPECTGSGGNILKMKVWNTPVLELGLWAGIGFVLGHWVVK